MKKILLRIFILLIISIILSSLNMLGITNATSTLYTINGILFGIGASLIVGFLPHGVKNTEMIKHLRKEVDLIKKYFFIEFSITTLVYMLQNSIAKIQNLEFLFIFKFNPNIFITVYIGLSIFYITFNFLEIQKLNNKVFDIVLKDSD